jgi:DNA-binding CsgD family transcriptional regulator
MGGPESQRKDAQQERRLFDTLLAALQTIGSMRHDESQATQRLLILLFEDLQWADDTTLDFVQYLLHALVREAPGTSVDDTRLLVLATYRSEAVPERLKLGRTISSCLAQRLARQIELKALSGSDFAKFVSATLGRTVASELASVLYDHSDGNPFVTEELLSAMAETGYLHQENGQWIQRPGATLRLPLSLRAAVLDRLASWSPSDRHVLVTAATVGREFDFDLVQRVTGLREAELLAVLRRAVDQQLLSEDETREDQLESSGERYRFRHVLTMEVILGELLTRERRLLHQTIAEALERELDADCRALGDQHPALVTTLRDSRSAQIAHHFLRAGLVERARLYAHAAGEWALSLGGHAEASEHFQHALISLDTDDPRRVPLLERVGTLRLSLLDVSRGLEALELARKEAMDVGARWQASAIAAETGLLLWFVDPKRAGFYLADIPSDAEARFWTAEPGDENALRLYAAAALHAGLGGSERRRKTGPLVWAERAREIVRSLPPAAERFLYGALIGGGLARIGNGQIADGVRDIEEAVSLGLRHSQPHVVILARDVLVQVLQELGRDAEALAVHGQTLEYARRTDTAWAPPSVLNAYLALGRWSEGIEAARWQIARCRELGLSVAEGHAAASLGQFYLLQGRHQDAAVELEKASISLNEIPQSHWLAPALRGIARMRVSTGRWKEAAALYEQCYAWWKENDNDASLIPVLLEGCLFYAERSDLDAAGRWAASLTKVANATQNPVALAAAIHAEGIIALALGDINGSMTALRSAAAAWRALDRLYDEARALQCLGEAALNSAGRDAQKRLEADRLLCTAADTFSGLGATVDANAANHLRRRAGLISHARRRRTVADSRAPFGGLTVREREVLQLIAEGQTNREIAHNLFIAESTAELHVSRILGKLGCATRAQAAAWAVSRQLVSAPQEMAAIS